MPSSSNLRGDQSCLHRPGGLGPRPASTPSPRLPGDPAGGTPQEDAGAGYLYVLHSTRREYTESKSLSTSRPAAWGVR